MTDNTNLPSVDEILGHALNELSHSRSMLRKAASRLRLGGRPIGLPLTRGQSHARSVTLAAIDDATVAIDRATAVLNDALHTDDQAAGQ